MSHLPASFWNSSRDGLPVRTKQSIAAAKRLIFVLWSFKGICSLADILKREASNAAFFGHVIVPRLVDNIGSHSRRSPGYQSPADHMASVEPGLRSQ
jgi:hypothetical protein